MTLIITADQQAVLTAVFKDANGGTLVPDLSDPHAPQPLWLEDSKGTIIVITPAEDQLTCVVVGIAPGTATVTCKDRGTDKQVTETVVVREGGIASIAISAGTPVKRESIDDKPTLKPASHDSLLGQFGSGVLDTSTHDPLIDLPHDDLQPPPVPPPPPPSIP